MRGIPLSRLHIKISSRGLKLAAMWMALIFLLFNFHQVEIALGRAATPLVSTLYLAVAAWTLMTKKSG